MTRLQSTPVSFSSFHAAASALPRIALALCASWAIRCAEPLPAPADVAAPPAEATVTDSGLAYNVLRKGDGTEHPKKTSTVRVHYTGWTTDGKMFDSSVTRGEPAEFPLNAVIAGWTEGLQLMVVNEQTRFWIPEKLAYKGQSGNPAGMLVFDVELLAIK
jgi:peptidylprolyl isomerase